MDIDRVNIVKDHMQAGNIDLLVCRLPENIKCLSGHGPLLGWSFLLFPLDGKPVCIVPHCDEDEARAELWDADCIPFLFAVLDANNPYETIAGEINKFISGRNFKRVGYEGDFECVAPPWNAAESAIPAASTRNLLEGIFGAEKLIDVTDLLNSQRRCKTSDEIEKLRIVNEIATFGLKAFYEKVTPGISGVQLAAEVEYAIMKEGTGYKDARRVRAFAQVSTGASETVVGFRPMIVSTNRKLENGDLALLELGVVADGFWSDRTRVRVAGNPTEEQKNIFNIVKSSQAAAIAKVQPGITAGEIDETARAIIRNAGYDKEFLHVTGHGVGFRYHEAVPLICPGSELVLQTGMIHTVEPGIYLAGTGGVRLEDNLHVTKTSQEVLGPFENELC